MVRPDFAISVCEMMPVEDAMALGGVEIGSVIASDAAMAVPKSSVLSPPTARRVSPMPEPTAQRIGMSRAAVAELEMKLESSQQMVPAEMSTTRGDHEPNGMEWTRSVASPDLLKPRPS